MKDKSLVEIRQGVYQKSPTKTQIGFSKRIQAIPKSRISDIERTLSIYGTFDVLAKHKLNVKWKIKSHPTDIGYFIRYAGLSDIGKKKLIALNE